MEWDQVVDVTPRQPRVRSHNLCADSQRVLATHDHVLDPVVEMGFRRFGGEDVGRSVDARDDAVQGASFSRNHRDEGTREAPGVREGDAAATVELARDPIPEAADEGEDVAWRRNAFTR